MAEINNNSSRQQKLITRKHIHNRNVLWVVERFSLYLYYFLCIIFY